MAVKHKEKSAHDMQKDIEEQTKVFLKAGGKITHINRGISGQQNLYTKVIVPNAKPSA